VRPENLLNHDEFNKGDVDVYAIYKMKTRWGVQYIRTLTSNKMAPTCRPSSWRTHVWQPPTCQTGLASAPRTRCPRIQSKIQDRRRKWPHLETEPSNSNTPPNSDPFQNRRNVRPRVQNPGVRQLYISRQHHCQRNVKYFTHDKLTDK
jgi:hypothetical protein